MAIAVAELQPSEAITYCNLEFERVTGQSAAALQGQGWSVLPGVAAARDDETHLGEAVLNDDELSGLSRSSESSVEVDAIAQSLRQNAKATLEVHSTLGEGVRVEVFFARGPAGPVALHGRH